MGRRKSKKPRSNAPSSHVAVDQTSSQKAIGRTSSLEAIDQTSSQEAMAQGNESTKDIELGVKLKKLDMQLDTIVSEIAKREESITKLEKEYPNANYEELKHLRALVLSFQQEKTALQQEKTALQQQRTLLMQNKLALHGERVLPGEPRPKKQKTGEYWHTLLIFITYPLQKWITEKCVLHEFCTHVQVAHMQYVCKLHTCILNKCCIHLSCMCVIQKCVEYVHCACMHIAHILHLFQRFHSIFICKQLLFFKSTALVC